jgi:hypothetical protein
MDACLNLCWRIQQDCQVARFLGILRDAIDWLIACKGTAISPKANIISPAGWLGVQNMSLQSGRRGNASGMSAMRRRRELTMAKVCLGFALGPIMPILQGGSSRLVGLCGSCH